MTLLLVGCLDARYAPVETAALAPLPPERLLTRVSLDLRGHRPSLSELERVIEEPEALEPLLESYVVGPGVGGQVASLWSEIYLTQADIFDIEGANFTVEDEARFISSLGEEPLRRLAYVAEHDLPYHQLFLGDWTMANEVLAEWYPVDYPADGAGWHRVTYQDGRPEAGVLATNGLWWRYQSTVENVHRGRANAVSRIFLCEDYLGREIEPDQDLDLLDEHAVMDALQTNDGCVACHHSLDPLGAYFWGFANADEWSPVELSYYDHDREHFWRDAGTGVGPSWFGQPDDGLQDLGLRLANDPRIVECFVEQATELLLQRPIELADQPTLTLHREAFLSGELTIRSVLRAVTRSDVYRAGATSDPLANPWKVQSAELMASQLEELTGFRFVADGYDVLQYDRYGLRSLAQGGGSYNDARSRGASPMTLVILEGLAESAAATVVAHDAQAEAPRLFQRFSPDRHISEDMAGARQQLVDLYLRVLALRVLPDGDQVDRSLALWEEVYALTQDSAVAWSATLTLLLRHPDFLVY